MTIVISTVVITAFPTGVAHYSFLAHPQGSLRGVTLPGGTSLLPWLRWEH